MDLVPEGAWEIVGRVAGEGVEWEEGKGLEEERTEDKFEYRQ